MYRDNRDIQAASNVVSDLFRRVHNDPNLNGDQYDQIMTAMVALRRAMPKNAKSSTGLHHEGYQDHVNFSGAGEF